MKKRFFVKALSLSLVAVLSFSLIGCRGREESTTNQPQGGGQQQQQQQQGTPAAPTDTAFNVVSIVNGNLGDRSFFDSAEAGLRRLASAGIINYRTVELGGTDADEPKWVDALITLSESGNYDVIVCGTWQMNEYLEDIAPRFPNQKYVIYDSVVELPNVLSLTYKQNDMGYIIGVFAAALTTEVGFPRINPEPVIGFVGGVDAPVINDFLAGYIQGALSVNPNIKVDVRYVGGFVDTATGKELGTAMIQQNNVDIIWGVAGLSGNGAAEAAFENNAWFIGVDSDQEATFVGIQAELANITLTSGLKNIGESLEWVFNELKAGREHWGSTQALGLDLNGVGIVTDKNFATTPQGVQDKTLSALAAVTNGQIRVGSAFGDNAVDVPALRSSVQP
jgi:basic membrane protein A